MKDPKKWCRVLGSLIILLWVGCINYQAEQSSILLTSDNKLVQARSDQFNYGSRLQVVTSIDMLRRHTQHQIQILEDTRTIEEFDNLILFFKFDNKTDNHRIEVSRFDDQTQKWINVPYQKIENTLVVSSQRVGKFRISTNQKIQPLLLDFNYGDVLSLVLIILLIISWVVIYRYSVIKGEGK